MGRISGARTPVILSFGAEMNGSWYSWGSGHTRPNVFVAAWRHVVSVFRQAGAHNVRWLWTVNSTNATAAPLKRWWPGNSYVNVAAFRKAENARPTCEYPSATEGCG